jgi:ABC-type taurine transport system ATPase subunit
MKVKKIKIEKFRHLQNVNVSVGNLVTAIAGQNGTGKSSILGLTGHIFSFREKDGTIKYKTIEGKPFETQFSEIFRLSPDYDKASNHKYSVELDGGEEVPVISVDRTESSSRKSLRFVVGKKARGEGKKNFPVIYLGLRRFFPLAQEEKVNRGGRSDLTQEEIQEYESLHNSILMLNEKINPEFVDTFSKKFYATKTQSYDCWGNSAGQDNIGQIITALLSFKRLKKELSDQYEGGLLLIDEVDATLFAGAQEKLLEKLFGMAKELQLQIIFTTHSIEILKRLMLPHYRHNSEVVFLDNSSGTVVNTQGNDITLTQMINNLCVMYEIEKESKIMVFCEDHEANLWLKNLLGTKVTKKLHIIGDNFGGGNLVYIANKKIPVFDESIFIVDGDQNSSLKNNKCPRVLILPGGKRPEDLFYEFLRNLPGNDPFWGNTGSYTPQVCFRDRPVISKDREAMKKWFNEQSKYWGRGCSKLFNRWAKDNHSSIESFKKEFEETLKKVSK